jgi:hypothetical protein
MKSKRKNRANDNELDRYFSREEIITIVTNDLSIAQEDISYLDYEKMKDLLEKETFTKFLSKEGISTEELYKLGESMVRM